MAGRQKGNQLELLVERHVLHADGYCVHHARQTGFKTAKGFWLSQSNDVFKAFDLIGKKKVAPTRWVQVTVIDGVSARRAKIDDLGDIWNDQDVVEVFGWVGGKHGKKFDHRYGVPTPVDKNYFQVYHLKNGTWEADEKIFMTDEQLIDVGLKERPKPRTTEVLSNADQKAKA